MPSLIGSVVSSKNLVQRKEQLLTRPCFQIKGRTLPCHLNGTFKANLIIRSENSLYSLECKRLRTAETRIRFPVETSPTSFFLHFRDVYARVRRLAPFRIVLRAYAAIATAGCIGGM
jgi:hypothetical protein